VKDGCVPRRALLSCWDKTGLVEFAGGLAALGIELISTGNTARTLRQAGLPVQDITGVTGSPEMMEGRVKTLHPAVHAGILARRGDSEDMDQLEGAGYAPIDLVAVNLYPFKAVVDSGAGREAALENIDIGGPTMLRAAAKNYPHVIPLYDPDQYPEVLSYLREEGDVPLEVRERLAVKAFAYTSYYDSLVARHLGGGDSYYRSWPRYLTLPFTRGRELKYGENPHQDAACYIDPWPGSLSLSRAAVLQGRDLSFNNWQDADAAVQIVAEFSRPAATSVKHANPCGVAVGDSAGEAFRRAHRADPISIYGGIVALNRPVDEDVVEVITANGVFLHVMIAPSFTPGALERLGQRKSLRVLRLDALDGNAGIPSRQVEPVTGRFVQGGLLLMESDREFTPPSDWRVVTEREPSEREREDLDLAWRVVKHARSNAVVLARDGATVGIGTGQVNRVDAASQAAGRAGEAARAAALASDAFIPFPDVVEVAARAGVTAIIQPGGSIRDEQAIAAADAAGMAMVFTGRRHFRH